MLAAGMVIPAIGFAAPAGAPCDIPLIPAIPFIASSMLAPRATVGVGQPGRIPTAGPPMFSTPIISPIEDHSATLIGNDVASRYRLPASRMAARFWSCGTLSLDRMSETTSCIA